MPPALSLPASPRRSRQPMATSDASAAAGAGRELPLRVAPVVVARVGDAAARCVPGAVNAHMLPLVGVRQRRHLKRRAGPHRQLERALLPCDQDQQTRMVAKFAYFGKCAAKAIWERTMARANLQAITSMAEIERKTALARGGQRRASQPNAGWLRAR
eukprot:6197543-Pleurochrysis_carterae.AAC.1